MTAAATGAARAEDPRGPGGSPGGAPGGPQDGLGRTERGRAPVVGLLLTVLLVAAAVVVPLATGWDVHPRDDDSGFAPTHGLWRPEVGLATPFAVALAVVSVRWGPRLAQRLPWRHLLLLTAAAAAAWMLVLALVDGPAGLTRAIGNRWEYLPTARAVTSVPELLSTFTARIPYSAAPDNWVTHIAGHPPGALLFFVLLVRLGLGGSLAAGLVVTALAATIGPAVMVALRALRAPVAARAAAPLLALSPAAVYLCVSGDAVFAAAAAWGLAALALATAAPRRGARTGWAVLAGLLLGTCVTFSYGLPLLGTICLGVLVAGRRWSPLPVAAVAALVPVLLLAVGGYAIWDAYPVLVDRYWDGIASRRPTSYWAWGSLAALAVCAGPVVGAGLGSLAAAGSSALAGLRASRGRGESPHGRTPAVAGSGSVASSSVASSSVASPTATSPATVTTGPVLAAPGELRVVALLVAGAAAFLLLATLSQMSKGETERIWLPVVPWLSLALLALPPRWWRAVLPAQVVWALLVQHLLYTSW